MLEITQDRLIEKNFVAELGIATAPYASVHSASQLAAAVETVGLPAVLKTRHFGYDGKGQAKIGKGGDPAAAWRSLQNAPCILEGFIAFEREVSMVAARGADGKVECFDVTENEHRDHILKTSRVPAKVAAPLAADARRIAARIAKAFGYVGVLAVEMFVVKRGRSRMLLVNEIAPRVHNSGHWTIDGATVSQFEQHIRAVAGWPLAKPLRLGRVEMTNLIGAEIDEAVALARRARRFAPCLRQGRGAAGPQDGPRDAGLAGALISPPARPHFVDNDWFRRSGELIGKRSPPISAIQKRFRNFLRRRFYHRRHWHHALPRPGSSTHQEWTRKPRIAGSWTSAGARSGPRPISAGSSSSARQAPSLLVPSTT